MISAMVLAAGKSRRMGVQKLLLPFQGQPMIGHVVDVLLESPIDEVIVVVASEANPIIEAARGRPLRIVTNASPRAEMLVSVRCGLTAMSEKTDAAMVVLGDQPGITSDVVTKLVGTFAATPRGVVVPTYQGRRGHPLLFSMHYRQQILTRYDGRGLRELLETHPNDVLELEVGTVGVVEDIDFPQDYQRAIQRTARNHHEGHRGDDGAPFQ